MARRSPWASYVIWGCVAVCAVLAASFTIALVVGAHRGISIAGSFKRSPPATARAASERPTEQAQVLSAAKVDTSALEIARLNDAVRALAAERDRLLARLEQVERSVGDITASIKEPPARGLEPAPVPPAPKQQLAAAPAEPLPPEPVPHRNAAQDLTGPLNIFQPYSSVRPPVGAPTPTEAPMQIEAIARGAQAGPAPASARGEAAISRTGASATRTQFAIDLGGDATIGGLRVLWTNLLREHGSALSGLQPLVSVQEGKQPGGVELRLIAGPLVNAATAARTCAALQSKGVSCQTAIFDGQRLALR